MASADFARAHGLRADFELAGWSLTSDAHHPVAPHRPTIARCIAEAIAAAELRPDAIATVNAHASSTKVGDKIEDEALHDVFGDSGPAGDAPTSRSSGTPWARPASSNPCSPSRACAHGVVLPTLNLTPDPDIHLDIVTAARPLPRAGVRAQERLRLRRHQHLPGLPATGVATDALFPNHPPFGVNVTAPTDPLVPELARKLVETLGLDLAPEAVDPDAPLIGAGLGIDSIDTLELVVLIEKDYGVKIDNRAAGAEAFASLNALAAFIRQRRPPA